MGVMLHKSGGGRRRRGRSRNAPMSEINVTPFVDVMLVLLIIFMITAPLLTAGVPLELPETTAKQLPAAKELPVTVSVNAEGKVFLQEAEVPLGELVTKLLAIAKAGYKETIYVRGDKATSYDSLMKLMGVISAAGFRKLSLVTNVESKG